MRYSDFPAYSSISHEEFLSEIRPVLAPSSFKRVARAYEFSKCGHHKETRENGRRYFDHPKAVAWIIIRELHIIDEEILEMALLHDIIEDSFLLDEETIEHNFGPSVAVGVKLLTKNPKEGYLDRLRRYATWKVLLVKMVDRLHNLRDLGSCKVKKQQKQIAETRQDYYPLVDYLVQIMPIEMREIGCYLKEHICGLCDEWYQNHAHDIPA